MQDSTQYKKRTLHLPEKLLFYGFLTTGLFLPTYIGINVGINLSPLRLLFIFLLPLLFFRLKAIPQSKFLLYALLFCLYLAISSVLVTGSFTGITYSLYFFEMGVAGFLVSSLYFKYLSDNNFFNFLVTGFFIIFFFFILEQLTGQKVLSGFITSESYAADRLSDLSMRFENIRATSIFKSSYAFAQVLCTYIIIFMFFLTRKRRAIIYTIFAILMFMLLATYTRSMIVLGVLIFIYFFLNRFKQKNILVFFSFLFIALIVFFSLQSILQLFTIDASTDLRIEQYSFLYTSFMAADYFTVFFGYGPYTTSVNPYYFVDNLYLMFFYEFGIFGLLLLLLYFYQLGKIFYKSKLILAYIINLGVFAITGTFEVLFLLNIIAGYVYSRKFYVSPAEGPLT